MSLATVFEFITSPDTAPRQLTVRSIADIRRDAFTPELRKFYEEHDATARAAEALRERYKLPSQRLAVGLALYKAKTLDEVPAQARPLLEKACLEHDAHAVFEFDRLVVSEPLRALRPARDEILRRFNENLVREMEADAANFAEIMTAVWAPFDCTEEIERGCVNKWCTHERVPLGPLRELRLWSGRAKEFLERGCPLDWGMTNEPWLDARRTLADVL